MNAPLRAEAADIDKRIALALARALLPGGARVPPVEASLIPRTAELVAGISPLLAQPWRWLHRALDAAAMLQTGRRFHALDEEGRERVLRRWQSGPARIPINLISMLYKLVHFDDLGVRRKMGGRHLHEVRALETPRWLSRIHRADDWNGGDLECDVVVVGTGAGGAIVGRELAERGHAVVFVEQGEHHRRDAFDGSAINAHRRFYRPAVAVGNAVMPVFIGQMVGGSTAVNGGTCFRTPPWILDRWCEELGTDAFEPERMTSYFERVEEAMEVAPAQQREVGPIRDVVSRGCDRLGWSHFHVWRNVRGCTGAGFCDFGCPTDARRSTNVSAIPAALQRGALLLTEAAVERVTIEGGRAVGVEARSPSGRRIRVRSQVVVLAGGAVPTPLLLLKQGLCARSGQVGRNLTLHPSAGVSGLMDESIEGFRHIPQGYGCDQFLRDGELLLAAQPDVNVAAMLFPVAGRPLREILDALPRIASLGLLARDATANGRVWGEAGGKPLITYRITAEDQQRIHSGLVHAMELLLAAGARRLYPTLVSSPILEPANLAAFRRSPPRVGDLSLVSYHPLGTCRMGRDPKSSVVGLDHQAHEVPRLYIVDGSTVPSALGVNPQLTIMAMAMRAADRIHDAMPAASRSASGS